MNRYATLSLRFGNLTVTGRGWTYRSARHVTLIHRILAIVWRWVQQ